VNPGFGRDELQDKADPEGGSEEFTRREAGESAGRKEDTHNGTNGGNSQANRKRADHPLAM